MIIQLRNGDNKIVYGTWLTLDQIDTAIYKALNHNKGNFIYNYIEKCMKKVFQNIVSEFDFLKEFDRGHTINESLIEATYDILYHNDLGLMAECNSKFSTHPTRILLKN